MHIIINNFEKIKNEIYTTYYGKRICPLNLLNICGLDIVNDDGSTEICMNEVSKFYTNKYLRTIYGYCEFCFPTNSDDREIEFIKTNEDLIKYLDNLEFL